VATGIGMDKRPEITLVTNKTTKKSSLEQRYQQMQSTIPDIVPLTEEKFTAKVVNEQNMQSNKDIDYLDIPAFLRKQAD
ncbi:MAG: cell division protein FtsZ, partial [Arsenophonus sp. ET-DL12-MAG3]